MLIQFILLAIAVYAVALIAVAFLNRLLWVFSGVFFLLDELMWFAYNPLRSFMKKRDARYNRVGFWAFSLLLVKPVWQLTVWVLTTPLRIISALYFDVLVYLFIMISDSVSELVNPKLGAMRFKKGFAYLWRWIVFLPYRMVWLVTKNSLAIVDSVMMLIISTVWPTFTMYHGTSKDNVVNITREGRWLVGPGNYGGSGIYFGRSPRVAISYAKGSRHSDQGRVIIARVTLSMLRNCATLPETTRKNAASPGDGGRRLAQAIKFPYYATEFWKSGDKWWEYCLVQGGRDGEFISSWRIRPIGYVHITGENSLSGKLERLWGGKAHYCLNGTNIAMTLLSVGAMVWLLNQLPGIVHYMYWGLI